MTKRPEPEAFVPRKVNVQRSQAILRLAMAWYWREGRATS